MKCEICGVRMGRFLKISCLLILGLFPGRTMAQVAGNEFISIHVKFMEQHLPRPTKKQVSGRIGIDQMDVVNARFHSVSVERIFPDAGLYETAHRAYGLHLWYEIRVPKGEDIQQAIAAYQGLGYFHRVEKCKEYTAGWTDEFVPSGLLSGANDPLFPEQWHFKNTGQTGGTPGADINLESAWAIETGSPNVIVAVIDGGIDLTHPDLAGALWTNADEIPNNGIDDDHNGYIDDVHGYGFGDKKSVIYPDKHGTHVAGTIGAITNNGLGVSGIAGGSGTADGIRLMSCAGFGKFETGGFEQAMVYAADNGAVISQNSWGGGSTAIEEAINYFVARAGFDNTAAKFSQNLQNGPMAGGVVIFAAGNKNTIDYNTGYPASYEKVIAVAATDKNDQKAFFSNYGPWVDISAPGFDVLSTFPDGTYGIFSGTSMACPHVSGVAALVISNQQRNGLLASDVSAKIRLTAKDITANNQSYKGWLGSGRIDAFNALQPPDAIPPGATSDLHVTAIHYSSVELAWTAAGKDGTTGQATAFDVRYSTQPITQENFDAASATLYPPVPPEAGTLVTFNVTGLTPATTYYFAVKTRDLFYNYSPMSNTAMASTGTSPSLDVLITSLSKSLFSGGKATADILLKNSGGDPMLVRLGVPHLDPAPVGLPIAAKARLFAIHAEASTIDEINPVTRAIIRTHVLPAASTRDAEGLAFDGTYLYYGNASRIYKLDANTGTQVNAFQIETATIDGLTWSGEYLYVADRTNGNIQVIDVDNGHVIRTINQSAGSLAFGGPAGTLYAVSSGTIVAMDAQTGSLIQTVANNAAFKEIAYSSTLGVLLVTDIQGIRAIHPATGDSLYSIPYYPATALAADGFKPQWLTTSDTPVEIQPGATVALKATFVASDLPSGKWNGTVAVIPVFTGTPFVLPVDLTVTGGAHIETIQSADFGIRYLGDVIDTTVSVQNRGSSDLTITDTHTNDPHVTASLSSMHLTPGQQTTLIITVAPTGQGPINASLTVTSNDPDEGTLTIPIYAGVFLPPAIHLSTDTIKLSMLTGIENGSSVTTTNNGGSTLHWQASLGGKSSRVFSSVPSAAQASTSIHQVGIASAVADSPEPISSLSYDATDRIIYSLSIARNTLYRYYVVSDQWDVMAAAPAGASGQSVFLNGNIYTGGSALNIFVVATRSWSTAALPVQGDVTVMTTDGENIYTVFGNALYRFKPATSTWVNLSILPASIPVGGLSYSNGVVLVHEVGHSSGDGNTILYKYYLESHSWTIHESISGKVCQGSAVDPASRQYFVLGSPSTRPGDNRQMTTLNLREDSWLRKALPFAVGDRGDIVSAGSSAAVYFSQGETGTGFGRYGTAVEEDWISIRQGSGTLEAGQSSEMVFDINTVQLDSGRYEADIFVSSAVPPITKSFHVVLSTTGAPRLALSQSSATLRDVIVGETGTYNLVIRNRGDEQLTISGITIDNADFSTTALPSLLHVGESVTLILRFSPHTAGPQTGVFTIRSNDVSAQPIAFTLTAKGVNPPIAGLSPGNLSATLITGARAAKDVMISNTGGSNFYFDLVPDAATDWIDGATTDSVQAGLSKTVHLTINAAGKAGGVYTGKVQCYSRSILIGEIPVTMTVTGAADMAVNRTQLDFKEQLTGHVYDSVVSIKNTGVLALAISGVSIDNPAFTTTLTPPLTLVPGQSADVHVSFQAGAVGDYSGNLTLVSNDPDGSPMILSLQAKSVTPSVTVVNPGEINSTALTDETASTSVTIANSGGGTLHWKADGESSNDPLGTPLPVTGLVTKLNPTPTTFIAPAVNPATGLLYAISPVDQLLYLYNADNDTWVVASHTPVIHASSGTSVFLNSNLYFTSAELDSQIFGWNEALDRWYTITKPAGIGGAITTDGQFLYLLGNGSFLYTNPDFSFWNSLPPPPIQINGLASIVYVNGAFYAHAIDGTGFARYDKYTSAWVTLPSSPAAASLGSAVNPTTKRYYTWGNSGTGHLYEFDMIQNAWTAIPAPGFTAGDGGLAFLNSKGSIYFTEGGSRKGFGRYEPVKDQAWLRLFPLSGDIPPGTTADVSVTCNAYALNTATYKGTIHLSSNDPADPLKNIPVNFQVTNPGPRINVPTVISAIGTSPKLLQIPVRIENIGLASLSWGFEGGLPPWVAPSKSSGVIQASSAETVTLFVATDFLGSASVRYPLTMWSNDQFHSRFSLLLVLSLAFDNAPIQVTAIPDQHVEGVSLHVSLKDYFSDPDGDALTYSIYGGSSGSVAEATIDHDVLTIKPKGLGSQPISIQATDPFDAYARAVINVYVDKITGLPERVNPELTATPNPFDRSFDLRYDAAEAGTAEIRLLDVTGRVAWQMTREELQGRNEVHVNADIASGVYFCAVWRGGTRTGAVRMVRK